MLHKRFGIVIESFWEMQFSFKDVLVDQKRIVVGKWVNTCYHFIDQHSQGPPIDWLPVTLILQDLGSEVFRSSAEGEGSIFNLLGKSKISQFEISISSNQNIFRFEIPVDDVFGVKVLKDENHVRCVKAALNRKYAALWGSNIPSSRRWVKSSPPDTNSIKM